MESNIEVLEPEAISEDVKSLIKVEAYISKSGHFNWLAEARDSSSRISEPFSKQLRKRRTSFLPYEEPPYSFINLEALLETSVVHLRCVKAKASDTVSDFAIVPAEGVEDPDEQNKDRLENFFSAVNQEEDFVSLLEKSLIDYETFGRASIEIARNFSGDPAAMWHIPAKYLRPATSKRGFYYKRENVIHARFFDAFPLKCKRDNGFVEWQLFNLNAKEVPGLSLYDSANEVLAVDSYHPGSEYYGLPDHIPAVGAMVGAVALEDYNFQLFYGEALPAFAVLVEGGYISLEDRPYVENYFKTARARGSQNVLILSVPGKDVKIKIERLDFIPDHQIITKVKEEARTDVLISHGVPPARVGLMEGSQLGGGRDLMELEAYKVGTIGPRRRRLSYVFNELVIKRGFGIEDWEISFTGLDVRDRKAEADINCKYVEFEVLTPDEVRADLGKEPKEFVAEEGTKVLDEYEYVELEEGEKIIGERLLKSLRTDTTGHFYLTLESVFREIPDVFDVDEYVATVIRPRLVTVFDGKMDELVRITQKRLKMSMLKATNEEVRSLLVDSAGARFRRYLDSNWLADCTTHLKRVVAASEPEKGLFLTIAENQMKGRSGLYAGYTNFGVNETVRQLAERNDRLLWWVSLGDEATCPDCRRMERGSPYEPGKLRISPGQGETRCLGNCRCYLLPELPRGKV